MKLMDRLTLRLYSLSQMKVVKRRRTGEIIWFPPKLSTSQKRRNAKFLALQPFRFRISYENYLEKERESSATMCKSDLLFQKIILTKGNLEKRSYSQMNILHSATQRPYTRSISSPLRQILR